VFVRILELMLGVPTAFGDTVSVSQARTPPAIDFECSQLFRASSSRLTGPRVPQKPAPWLRQMRSETTVGLLRKSTVYGLNGHRRRPLPVHGLRVRGAAGRSWVYRRDCGYPQAFELRLGRVRSRLL